MRIVLDTSVIVDIDRKKENTIAIIKKLIDAGDHLMVSTVTVSEILTGSYLREDTKRAVETAKRILGQFLWIDLDSQIAEYTARSLAYLIAHGKRVEYQDVVIAATAIVTEADYVLTHNTPHFTANPFLKGKVCTPQSLLRVMENRKS